MKAFYLVGSVLFTTLILIIGFQNFGAQINGFTVFFSELQINGTLIVFGVAILGVLTGGFYFGFLTSFLRDSEEEENGSDFMA